MIKDSTILFLGVGQIGRASCLEILRRYPKKLILHTLTPEESEESLSWIRENADVGDTELVASSGDIMVAYEAEDQESLLGEINFRYGTLSYPLVQASNMWKLIDKHRPNLIVDGINTATYVGYGHDPFTSSRAFLKILETNQFPERDELVEMLKSNLLAQAIPQLIRFTQVLHLAMVEFDVKRYVKVSTSGLGGMGFNIPYTHGDLDEPGCSPRLLGKVTAAGICNQLLWTLSHTPGLDVKLLIPTALVGWDDITTEITQRKEGRQAEIPLVDCEQPIDLTRSDAFTTHQSVDLGRSLEVVAVGSGENGYYALGDMSTITTLGQMGCITKEEVGFAVAETLEGSTRYDMCTAMDSACLGPSFFASFERNHILSEMQKFDKQHEFRSVSLGNLGPTVTKHLWELEILRILRTSLQTVLDSSTTSLTEDAEKLIMHTDTGLRSQILSHRMPILLEGNRLLLGSSWRIPQDENPQNIRLNMEDWALEGWIDLRASRMAYWQFAIGKVSEFFAESTQSQSIRSRYNWRSVTLDDDFNVGEVLGLIYSLKGGNRKLD